MSPENTRTYVIPCRILEVYKNKDLLSYRHPGRYAVLVASWYSSLVYKASTKNQKLPSP